MDLYDSRYYRISKFLLSRVGMWPYQKLSMTIFTRCLVFCSLTTALIPQMFCLLSVWNNVDDFLDCLPPLFVVFTAIGQTFVYLQKEQQMKALLEFIKADWKIWSCGTECEILRRFAEDGRIFLILFSGYMYATVGVFIIMSMTPIVLDILIPLNESRPKQMVYPILFPFSHEENFHWILIHGSMTAFYNITIVTSCEGMYAVMTQHACGLFAIISYRLKNAMKIIERKNCNEKRDLEDELYNDMSYAIERHTHAIEFASSLESCYSPILFFTVGLNMISTSVVGIQTLISLGQLDKTIKFGTFAIGLGIHLYCLSLPAQKLLDHSTQVVQNVYDECWYQMPSKSRKLLPMIIMRGHIPCKLTAGKFYTMDMITFSNMLKTAVSYFTVLSSFR